MGQLVTSYRVGDLTITAHETPMRENVADPGARASAPHFVLVHGIGVSSRYFGPTTDALARFGTVYAVDLPGYGNSPKAGREVSIADHADALAGFIMQAGLRAPTVVGHSMGTQVASQLAVDAPELVGALVLAAPTMPPRERTLPSGAWRLLVDARRNPLRADLLIAADYLFRCRPPYFFAQTRHLFGDRIETRAHAIRVPTLVLVGEHDLVVPLHWASTIADLIPDARLRVVAGPHVMMFHEPDALARIIAEHARS